LDSPYNDLECYLLILHQLLYGYSNKLMEEFIPPSTFGYVYSSFWKSKTKELSDLADNILNKWYSSPSLRIATSNLKNPSEFAHITILGDGHDNRVDYSNKKLITKAKNRQLISYKTKKSCVRTQVFIDCNDLPIFVSETNTPNIQDGTMLKDSYLYKILTKNDCV